MREKEQSTIKTNKKEESLKYILASDIGSTTTKTRLFTKINGQWRYMVSGESPTTVEAPYENVIIGLKNAVREIEELTGLEILSDESTIIKMHLNGTPARGVDFFCTTSSAGGGLQMMVGGVIKTITAESAQKAALGAGAIVMDTIAIDDGKADYEKIEKIRLLRPDMILLAGGTDGGTTELVMEIAEIITAAEPKARLGANYDLPLIFAGNKEVRPMIANLMGDKFALSFVDNLRPILEVENIEPARSSIHELFMEHVMSHAPGYQELMKLTDLDIMPTPAGEGIAMQLIASIERKNIIGVGLGGATTNVYSIFDGRFVRSVSANLGMSYSICNVMKETGVKNIMRWVPFDIDEDALVDTMMNKMIRPTTIPFTLKSLLLEHAIAREAIKLGLEHHKTLASRLKGMKTRQKMIGDIMELTLKETYIDMMNCDIIVGTGGLLSHAPNRAQSLLIMIDAFQPEGITKLYQDSVFMMPHLGVLSTVYPKIAWNIFDKDCLVRLGSVIAPVGTAKQGEHVVNITLVMPNNIIFEKEIQFGEIIRVPLPEGLKAKAVISPESNFNIGNGPGMKLETTIEGGVVGVVIDVRGRPLILSENSDWKRTLVKWFNSLNVYPIDFINEL